MINVVNLGVINVVSPGMMNVIIAGVMKHVGDALGDTIVQARNNIVTIGIAPWGVVHKNTDLIGQDVIISIHLRISSTSLRPQATAPSRLCVGPLSLSSSMGW